MYPEVTEQTCIKCGKCVSICAASVTKGMVRDKNTLAYAACTKDEALRRESSSGGIFSELAKAVLGAGGVVFGAAFDETFAVKHVCVDDAAELDRLRGSKYVQSEVGTAYLQAKEYLERGRKVLFTGTPCQIGGLLSFLGKPYENLYTQDIICHGVPSPKLWKKYVDFRQMRAKSGTKRVSFRAKLHGWRLYSIQFEFENGKQYIKSSQQDPYMRSFLRDLPLRPSCYNCAFKTKQRQSDLTLADFWGIEKVCPELDDDRGTSLVILHSEKGGELFETIKGGLNFCEVEVDDAIKYNSAMTMSAPPNPQREEFIRTLNKKGFCAIKKYVRVPLIHTIIKIIKSMISR